MIKTAKISRDGKYRYVLTRMWGHVDVKKAGLTVNWIMLNPSTADDTIDDPTIRRCIAFSQAWGFGGMTVTNLYAYRSRDPRELLLTYDPIGSENDSYLRMGAIYSEKVICAWGARAQSERVADVRRMLLNYTPTLYYLRLTKHGQPCHPLYLPNGLKPKRWK